MTSKLLLAGLGASLVSVAIAQQSEPAANTAGLLGQRYVEAGLGYQDINNFNRGAYSLFTNVNLPVASNLDLNAGYAYGWLENNGSVYQNAVDANLVGHIEAGAFRPFASAGLGYVWLGDNEDNFAVWNLGTGVEYALNNDTALRVSVAYSEGFESHVDGQFAGTVGANHWFTENVGGNIGVAFIEGGDIAYGASVLFKF